MDTENDYVGHYYYMGLALEVKQLGEQLVVAMHGVPDGYEMILEPLQGDQFRSHGGPIDGSVVKFTRDEKRRVTALHTGQFEMMKVDPSQLADLPLTQWLLAPDPDLSPSKRAQFDHLLQSCLQQDDGGWIPYDLPYPRHEFVQYLSDQDRFIFHGSNNLEIETFQPFRKSMELRDSTGRGNIAGVYGTHDGLWSMFFAVIDRSALRGSIRNGVMYFQNRAGERLPVYHFSINQEQLAQKPLTEGALYLLPRSPFKRLRLTDVSFANEWASEEPVRAIAKLHLQPGDFPFLDRIGGHDDGELLRLEELSAEIRASAVAAQLAGDRLEVTLPAAAAVASRLDEYIALQKVMIPAAAFEVRRAGDEFRLVVTSIPPAVVHLLQKTYAELLTDENVG